MGHEHVCRQHQSMHGKAYSNEAEATRQANTWAIRHALHLLGQTCRLGSLKIYRMTKSSCNYISSNYNSWYAVTLIKIRTTFKDMCDVQVRQELMGQQTQQGSKVLCYSAASGPPRSEVALCLGLACAVNSMQHRYTNQMLACSSPA